MRLRLFFCVAILAFGGLMVAPLQAHSEVFERAPAAGQIVGGTVDRIDISFWAPIAAGDIQLLGPNDEPVAVAEAVLAENQRIITADISPLEVPGIYVVTHTELADDGDEQTARFQFTFDPDSGERVSPLISRDTGPNWVLLGGIGGVILLLAGLFWPGRRGTPP